MEGVWPPGPSGHRPAGSWRRVRRRLASIQQRAFREELPPRGGAACSHHPLASGSTLATEPAASLVAVHETPAAPTSSGFCKVAARALCGPQHAF